MRTLGRNIYSTGGGMDQLYNYLFDEDSDHEDAPATAPDETELPTQQTQQQPDDSEYQSALQMAMSIFSDDPHSSKRQYQSIPHGLEVSSPQSTDEQPYNGQILSSGQYGSQHVGEFGKKIYGELATDLGYAPVANSIYRDPTQQESLIKQGYGARNSYHLTGNAVDIKPSDWQRLSQQQQAKYRSEYDVLYHNNHYHLEPK